MTPLIVRYPLDPTGANPNNLVAGEIQNLTPNRNVRAIATLYGAFFTESLVVTDVATGLPLTPNTQYYAAEMYELPTARYGKEICAVILITDPTVSNQVSLQYQALGGPYGTSATAIIQQIENLQLDTRPVAWGDILDRPSEFPPAFHLHDVGDVYGFEYLVHAIDRVRDAIEVGDSAQYDQIYAYIDHLQTVLQAEIDSGNAGLSAHLADFGNPHRTTATQVGAYTIAQSDAITTPINNTLQAHVANITGNPHHVTAAQVGAYTTAQSDANLSAVNSALTTAINNHIANHNNPHVTTAAQVGAYTIAQSDANLAAGLNSVRIPFTPVQQGGGVAQATNKVYLGWDGSRLRCTVDGTDLQGLIAVPEFNANVANLQNQINARVVIGNTIAYTDVNQTVTFWDVHANGTLYSANDVWAFFSDQRLKTDVEDITNAREKLRKVRAILYKHNVLARDLMGADLDRVHMGLLAQEVFAVCPEIVGPAPFDIDPVSGGSKSGEFYLTIQYEKFCVLLLAGLKELDTEVLNHEERIAALEA